jgi:acetyl esterase
MTPETEAFLNEIAGLPPVPAGHVEAIRERRRLLASRFDSGPAGLDIVDDTLGGVPVRTYSLPNARDDVVIVYVHGGGWVAGDLDTHDGVCRRFAVTSGLRVISVDYRRPPEHRHPAAVTDVVAVVRANGSRRVVLAGDSSGGHIAVEAALELGTSSIVTALILLQPASDPAVSSRSWESLGTGYFLTAAAMRWYWDTYLPDGTTLVPLSERDLSGLPRCYVVTSSLDPSQDDGIRLAASLLQAGVPVIHEHLIGVPHGCFTLPRAFPDEQSTIARAAAWAASPAGDLIGRVPTLHRNR